MLFKASTFTRMARNPSHHAPSLREVRQASFVPAGPPDLGAVERSLRDAVLADPESDAPRRAYAVACGGPRGEFISTQIENARYPTATGLDREADLLARHGAEWVAELAPWSARDVVFRRGFAESLSLSGRAFISLGEGLFRTAPVREVRLVAMQPYLAELAACPHLARLRGLDLSGNRIGTQGLRTLLAARAAQFEALDLSCNDLGNSGVKHLACWPGAGALRSLSLRKNGIGAVSLEAFASLEHLAIAGNPITADVLDRLPSRLMSLEVAQCRVPGDRIRRFTALERLDLSFHENDALDFTAWPRLRSLIVRSGRIDSTLAELGTLEHLDLTACPLGHVGIETLAASASTPQELHLTNCGLDDDGIERLVHAPLMRELRSLSLAWNPCGDRALRALVASPAVTFLRTLDLTGTRLTFRGACDLARSRDLPLRTLILDQNPQLPADAAAMLRERFS